MWRAVEAIAKSDSAGFKLESVISSVNGAQIPVLFNVAPSSEWPLERKLCRIISEAGHLKTPPKMMVLSNFWNFHGIITALWLFLLTMYYRLDLTSPVSFSVTIENKISYFKDMFL